jgi:MoaA/NifB/PqqE/SkfB family radical SAM enzyme
MNLPNKTFCVLPWISLETSPLGTVRPCCLANDEIVDAAGNKFEISKTSFYDIQQSAHMMNLRREFLQGKQPETCNKCWTEEASGRTSKRMHTQDRLKHIISDMVLWSETPAKLMFLDLKLGNICNLKCRICGSWSSSSSAAEQVKVNGKNTRDYEMLKQGAWPRSAPLFWADENLYSTDLRYLEFTGGEPFMIKEHFEYLEKLVEAELSENIEIHYNTNGTQWPAEYIDIWRHFKHVEIAFSIDNTGLRFEYERKNAKWDNVNDNIQKFIDLRESSSNMSLQLCTTINIYNVLYLKDIVHWKHFTDFDFVYWNMLQEPAKNCISSLPQNAKDAIEKYLLDPTELPIRVHNEFRNIAKFMQGESQSTFKTLMADIYYLDDLRDENLEFQHPELFKLLSKNNYE